MASVSRQPFAPLDGTRLQNLTSLKNRQNAISNSPAPSKRKAEVVDTTGDAENVDPLFKRSKALKTGSSKRALQDDILKPNYVLKTVASKPLSLSTTSSPSLGLSATSASRRTLQPKSPAARLNTSISKSSPLSAPAGRSPTRGKRSGILSSRRRTSGPFFSRADPPSFNIGGSAPFSLDAALKGTIPSYGSRQPQLKPKVSTAPKPESEMKSSWFFDIHEDTVEQEMTNLLQHSTCVLDISSDEESANRARREDKEDKENVPPVDDVSQTSARAQARLRQQEGDMVVEKERVALGEMKAADFYAEGCDETSVILVPADGENILPFSEKEEPAEKKVEQREPAIAEKFEFAPELMPLPSSPGPQTPDDKEPEPPVEVFSEQSVDASVNAIMAPSQSDELASSAKAAVLLPIEGTGESFELWESSSAKDEQETAPELSS